VSRQPELLPTRRRPSSWAWLVTGSAVVVGGCALALVTWWIASRETTVTTYSVRGPVNGIVLDLGEAGAEIVGGGDRPAVEVRRTDRFAFGRPSDETHEVENGTLLVRSRCPDQVIGSCRASFHIAVPDNVPLDIETSRGTVRLAGVRTSVQITTGSGDIEAAGFCGFALTAGSDSGDIGVVSECPAERLELRSRTGDVHATAPTGRYTIDAQSDNGKVTTRGLIPTEDAGFVIQANSTDGDVTVEAG
jgi:hypothetical protein